MELDFDKIFKIPTCAMNLNRSHPYIPRDKKWVLQFSIVHGIYTLVFIWVVYNIVYHDLKINNFSQTCKNGSICVLYVGVTFQYCILLWHQDLLLDLINDIKKDYEQTQYSTSDEKEIVYKYVRKSQNVCKQWLVISGAASVSFFIKSIGIMLYFYCIDEFKLVPLYELIYPAAIQEYKDNIYVFCLAYAVAAVFDVNCGIMYASYVPLGSIFMLHGCAQLELVKKQIDDLFVDYNDQVIREKLKNIIHRLQYIYSFVDRIEKVFKISNEFTLKANTILLPITLYEVLEAFYRGEASLEFITFVVGGIVFCSSPCYYSDLLMEKGEDVRLSIYTCGWEQHYDRRTRTTLQMLLQRALRPIALRTVFSTLCLDYLTDLFQQSFAIFNLMNAMWK